MDAHPMLGRARAVVLVALGAIVLVAADASAASAHTASGPRPTNFRTTVRSITPAVPGIRVRVADLGNRLELTNRTATDVVVLGYRGEPYLRVGPRGVYENTLSPATYLNRTRSGSTRVPAIASAAPRSAPPRWHRVGGGHTASWHDHRVHWMGAQLPPVVRRDPGAFHVVTARWTVGLRYGDRSLAVTGRLDWVPGPSGWLWLPVIGALAAAGFVAACRKRTGAAIAAVIALIGIDITHAITAEAARTGALLTRSAQFLGDNFVSVIVWVAAAITVRGLRRGDPSASYGLVLVGAMVALVGGLTDLSSLWKSQLSTIGPLVLARAEVAAGLGLGAGVVAGALAGLLRSTTQPDDREERDPHWLERLIGDLDDDAVSVVAGRLTAAEVIPIALRALATRATPAAPAFGDDALVFVVVAQDQIGTHTWSITAGGAELRVQRGTPARARAELRTTFPVFLQLLSGARTLAASSEAGRLDVAGDAALVAAIEPFLHPDAARARPVATV